MYNPSVNNLQTVQCSLTNGAPSATIFTGVAGQVAICQMLSLSSSDSTQQLVTVQDSSATPIPIWKGYITNNQAVVVYFGFGAKTGPAKSITVTAGAVSAAKTIECTINLFRLPA